MNIIKQCATLITTIKKKGLWQTILKGWVIRNDIYFDSKYTIDTHSHEYINKLVIDSTNKDRGTPYQGTRVVPLQRCLKKIESMIPQGSSFIDFGCGKGRVLLVASQFGFKKEIGVEFDHELCKISKENCRIFKNKSGVASDFSIIESDVVDYVIKGEDNVFLCLIHLMKW